MTRVITKKQEQAARRIAHIVGTELVSLASSPVLLVNWDDVGVSTYTMKALEAIYAQLEKDGVIPPRAL